MTEQAVSMVKKVAILGGGASGLTAIKGCLDEGLIPVCFERTDHIGGLWYFTEDERDGQACVSKSTVINTSKEFMCFSDFPIPKEYPNFMHNTYVIKYFNLYADHFDLRKHIRFNTEVNYVTPTEDFDTTGQWKLETTDKVSGDKTVEVYDAVLVCTGHHAEPHIPTFQGLEQFKGVVLHSHGYKSPKGYADKRVLVIGIGNSGADAAVDTSTVAAQVFQSTRRGAWVASRLGVGGLPSDLQLLGRFPNALINLLGMDFASTYIQKDLNKKIDHEIYGLKPKHNWFGQHPTVHDELPNRILSGRIVIKPNVKRFTLTGVEFEDGTFEDNIDVVIMATGYKFGFPALDKSVIEVQNNELSLYKYMFNPDLKHHTLAVIGYVQPVGALFAISELQCRLATRVFKGLVQLPDRDVMLEDIRQKRLLMKKRYVNCQRHTIQVDFVPYMDELAEIAGCKPNIGRLFLLDIKLAYQCFFGPYTPVQYRLQGPGSWPKARETILTTWDRVLYPLATRKPAANSNKTSPLWFFMKLVVVLVLAWIIMQAFSY